MQVGLEFTRPTSEIAAKPEKLTILCRISPSSQREQARAALVTSTFGLTKAIGECYL